MMTRKMSKILLVAYLVFFSLPMVFVCGFPWGYKWYWMYGIDYLTALLGALIPLSPWALLLMASYCYKKKLKLETYVSTLLFLWAALTELFVILYFLLLEHPPLRNIRY